MANLYPEWISDTFSATAVPTRPERPARARGGGFCGSRGCVSPAAAEKVPGKSPPDPGHLIPAIGRSPNILISSAVREELVEHVRWLSEYEGRQVQKASFVGGV